MSIGTDNGFPSLKATWLSIKTEAVWRVIRTVVSADSISLKAKAAIINAAVVLGNFLLYVRRQDEARLSDTLNRQLSKKIVDAFGALDHYASTISKSKSDSAAVTDYRVKTLTKALSDLSSFTEMNVKSFGKALQEQCSSLDKAITAVSKVLKDTAGASDQINTKAVTKSKSDTSTLSDDESRQVTKVKFDQAAFSDTRLSLIQKALKDNINVTDDIDGAASILDDQEVQFFKAVSEIAQTQDQFYRLVQFVRNYTDATSLSDKAVATVTKPAADQATATDTRVKTVTKATSDTAGTSDMARRDHTKPIADTSSVSELKATGVSKSKTDSAGVAERISNGPQKSRADSTSVSDYYLHTVTKGLSETINAADFLDYITIIVKRDFVDTFPVADLLALATQKQLTVEQFSLTDLEVISTTKPLSELAFLQELLYRNTSKELANTSAVSESKAISAVKPSQDSFSLTDSGSLRSQGYCDFTYIAEDYVGASRTF